MTLQWKIISWVVGALILIGMAFGAKTFYDHYQELKGYREQATKTGEAAESVSESASTASAAADSVTQHTVEVRTIYRTKYEELKNEDHDVALWADGRVPLGVRFIQCQRRAARDGLTDHEAGCGRLDPATGQSQ